MNFIIIFYNIFNFVGVFLYKISTGIMGKKWKSIYDLFWDIQTINQQNQNLRFNLTIYVTWVSYLWQMLS